MCHQLASYAMRKVTIALIRLRSYAITVVLNVNLSGLSIYMTNKEETRSQHMATLSESLNRLEAPLTLVGLIHIT